MKTLLTLVFTVLASLASAEPYAVGATLPRIELPDQHGEARVIDDSVRAIVFSRDMKAGDVVKAAVAKAGPDLFDRNAAVYVVNVTGMPAIIRSLFAMPAIRRRPYKLLVDDQGTATADFPGGATTPTVMLLEKGKITGIEFPTTPEALIALIEKPAPPQ